MKVTITVPGRFHAFNLAQGLYRLNYLDKIITSYPIFIVKKYGIPSKFVISLFFKELYCRVFKIFYKRDPQNIYINILFDFVSSVLIPKNSDVYIVWAGFSKITIKRIKKINPKAKIFLERGSTHIEFQYLTLSREYLNFPKIKFSPPQKNLRRREIIEYELTDFISVPTEFTKKTFLDHGVLESKIFVNPYGVDLRIFEEKKYSTEDKDLNILFTGNFSVRKGAYIFLKIFELCSKKKYIKFHIVGTIEVGLSDYLAPYIKDGQIKYNPHLPQYELPKVYQNSDIFFFPSHEEGFALVLLQAMASGLCVVASDNSGFGSVYNGKNGYLCDLSNICEIVHIFDQLYHNRDLLLDYSKNSRKSILNKYSWEEYVLRAVSEYKSVTKL